MLTSLIAALLLALTLAIPLHANAAESPLRISMTGAYRPLSTTDRDGKLVGFDADIALAIGRELDRAVDHVQVPWAGLQGSLQAGKEDLICGSMGITAERQEQMYFTLPYYVSGAQLFVRDDLASIAGARIGVTQGTTYGDFIRDHPEEFSNVQVIAMSDEATIIAALNAGKLDAFVSDRIVGGFYLSRGTGETRIKSQGDLLFREACGIAARRSEEGAALVREVNEALRAIVASGEYTQIYRKWVGRDPDLDVLKSAWLDHQAFIPPAPGTVESHESSETDYAEDASEMLTVLGKGAWMTIKLSVITAILSLILGGLLGVLAHSRNAILRGCVKAYVFVIRGTPLLVQLFLSYLILATFLNNNMFGGDQIVGAFGAGLIALVLNTTAYNAETMRGGIASVDSGQWQAAASLGMTRWQTLKRIVLPQAVRHALPSLGNNFIVLVKDTSLVGAITLVELTWSAQQLVSSSGYALTPFLLAAAYYLLLISLVSWGMNEWEKRLSQSSVQVGGAA